MQILEEARQPDTTVAEVLRRHQVDATTSTGGRSRRRRRCGRRSRSGRGGCEGGAEIERLRAELGKKRGMIAEVVEENLELKKSYEAGVDARHAGEKEKRSVLVRVALARTGWGLRRILKRLGFPRSLYYEWRERAVEERLADCYRSGRCLPAILAEEKEAVIEYALDHPKEGYRRLAWMMINADVA